MAGLATTTAPPGQGPRSCTSGSSWVVRVCKPALPAWPGPDLAAPGAATSVRIEWISFSFSCFRDRWFRGGKSASVLGFEAPKQRGKADQRRTAIGAPEMKLAGCEPASYEGGRDVAKAGALKRHRFCFGATGRAPGHDGFAPAHHQQAFGFNRDPCRFHTMPLSGQPNATSAAS